MSALTLNLCVTVLFLGFCCTFLSAASENENNHRTMKSGESFAMECTNDGQYDSLYVRVRRPEMVEMLFINKQDQKTLHNEYKERASTNGGLKKLTITISNLKTSDSGVYWCEYSSFIKSERKETGSVLLQVEPEPKTEPTEVGASKTKEPAASNSEPLVLASVVMACAAVLLIGLVVGLWVIPKMKTLCRGPHNESSKGGVYEDMRAHRRYTGESRI